MRVVFGGALVLMGLFTLFGSALAQGAPDRTTFWKQVQEKCDATAGTQPSKLARDIADRAKAEHALWAGHRIDHHGRLYEFGLVESENEESSHRNAVARHIGWWNVWRYWRHLMNEDTSKKQTLLDTLAVTEIRSGLAETNREGRVTSIPIETKALLAAIDQISDDELQKLFDKDFHPPAGEKDYLAATRQRLVRPSDDRPKLQIGDFKEALRQSVIRAFVNDNAWSAAFVSYVVDTSKGDQRKPKEFQSDVAHRTYIGQAINATKDEIGGTTTITDYRACPIHDTTPRVGDLICYQRQPQCAGAKPEEIRDFFAFKSAVASTPSCETIKLLHCDIVSGFNDKEQKIYSIGGNVQQSVTERRLNIYKDKKGKFVFSPNQGQLTCDFLPGVRQSQVGPEHKRCSLNKKGWFVLLQMKNRPELADAR
jgi:hypothetical protein